MNILIVGNGFDLSHYLPTKYDHFMDVMKAIEEKQTGDKVNDLSIHTVNEWIEEIDKIFEKRKEQSGPNYSMDFDELFSKTRESYFIEKTKELYLTEKISLSAKDVLKLQYRLELNSWYQYFKNHVEEIKTWIDFEQQIKEVLVAIAECIILIEQAYTPLDIKDFLDPDSKDKWKIKEKHFKILNFFDLWEDEEYVILATEYNSVTSTRPNLSSKFCHGENLENGFNSLSFLSYLQSQLEEFIEIFNLYLDLIVSNLKAKNKLEIFIKSKSLFKEGENDWIKPNRIYSFNYTNTYQRIHDLVEEVEYLHGRHGEEQNIVLGISDLEDESLKKIKAYGFTKYHQKLFKDTDYLFLDSFKEKVKDHKKKIEYFEKDFGDSDPMVKKFTRQNLMEGESKLNLNISIWGHSLDVSDKDYIIDLFSLNDDMDRNVRVKIYHFNKFAKFDLLNNLLAILGKDKIEHWMKKGWLKFEKNPDIAKINGIKPVDLPKL